MCYCCYVYDKRTRVYRGILCAFLLQKFKERRFLTHTASFVATELKKQRRRIISAIFIIANFKGIGGIIMDYFERIFERANLQQIRSFLMSGAEYVDISDKSYSERKMDAWNKLAKALKEIISDDKEFDRVSDAINAYSSELNNIYMEIGICCGFMIAEQLYKK